MPSTKFDKPVFPGAKLVETTVTVSNTSGSYSNTFTDERVATSMRAFQIEIEDPSIFNDKITITTANGSFTLSCDEVAGETDVTIGFLKIADDPTEVTSTEFTVLNNRIGDLSSLTTTEKTSAVAAINENKQAIAKFTKSYVYTNNSYSLPANTSTQVIGNVSTLTNGVVTSSNLVGAILIFNGIAAIPLLNSDRSILYIYAVGVSTSAVTQKLTVVFFYT